MMSNGYKSTGQGLDGNSSPTPQEGNYIFLPISVNLKFILRCKKANFRCN